MTVISLSAYLSRNLPKLHRCLICSHELTSCKNESWCVRPTRRYCYVCEPSPDGTCQSCREENGYL